MTSESRHESNLAKFADKHNLTLVIRRMPGGQYEALFEDSMVMTDNGLQFLAGAGKTFEEATADYHHKLMWKMLVINCMEPCSRREIGYC